MKLVHYKSAIYLLVILLVSIGCAGQTETESGIKYNIITKGSGEVPEDGGMWVVNMAYFDAKGDTMFSSTRDRGGEMAMPYKKEYFPKNGSFEECFGLLGKGDSSIFIVSADSLFKNSYHQPTPPEYQGTMIELRMGVTKIYSKEEYDAKLLAEAKEQMAAETKEINEYLQREGIEAEVTEEGLYYTFMVKGDGVLPEVGQKVKVNYTGYLLDGTVFDTSVEEDAKAANVYTPGRNYAPFTFTLGRGEVIRGWDLGIALMPVGSKAKIIVPSPLAYGAQARGPVISANSILVFDVELVGIEK